MSSVVENMSVSRVTLAMTSLDVSNPTTLLNIPLELRHSIYRFVFDHDKLRGTITALDRRQPKDKLAVPSIMLLCKQIRREALQIYWENRQIWLNSVTYGDSRKPRTSLLQIEPLLSDDIRTNIRHIRGQCIEKWGMMNRGRARYLLQRLPNLRTFRFHGASHIGPFWTDGVSQYPDIMKRALRTCGGNFKPTNPQDIIASFPTNPKTCKIEFQLVIVITCIVLDDYDYYLLYINLDNGKHLFVPGWDDIEELTLGHWDEDEEIWRQLRR
ncbi:hypothetical protein F5Y18DRAFT_435135 [Xylariaceae sp. FL1019]|nr:hypothetical protein F5Y18DRAFT_435135 [Xylariaceae sp. FL1019]